MSSLFTFEFKEPDIHRSLSALPADESRALIAKTIQDFRGHITSFHSVWNHLAPISSLPSDILALVLTLSVGNQDALDEEEHDEDSNGYSRKATARHWSRRVQLTSVCRAWRDTALGYSPFWAGTILNPHCNGLSLMLPRWKNHPRMVWIQIAPRRGRTGEKMAEQFAQLLNGDLLERVMIECDYDATQEDFDSGWPRLPPLHYAPVLRSLHCEYRSFRSYGESLPIQLPPLTQLLVAGAAALQDITLKNCTIDWRLLQGSLPFKNLLNLHLEGLSPPPPSDVLNNLLSSTRSLQILHFDTFGLQHRVFLFAPPPPPPRFVPNFQWPNPTLRHCKLRSTRDHPGENGSQSCADMVSRITSLPVHTDIKYDVTIESPEMERCFPGLHSSVSAIIRNCIESLDANGGMTERILHVKHNTVGALVSAGKSPHERLKFRFPSYDWPFWLDEQFVFPEAVEHLLLDLPSQHRHKPIHVPSEFYQSGAWLPFLQRHPHLRRISIQDFGKNAELLKDLALSLKNGMQYDDERSNHAPVLPRLSLLSFVRVNFSDLARETTFFCDLNTALVSRNRMGMPIGRVEFRECTNLCLEDIREMRRGLRDASEVAVWNDGEDVQRRL